MVGILAVFGLSRVTKAETPLMNGNESLLYRGQCLQHIVTGQYSFIESWSKINEKYKGYDMYLIELMPMKNIVGEMPKDIATMDIKFAQSFHITLTYNVTLVVTQETDTPGTFIASFGRISQ